jgi:hypothetical protein
LKEFKQTKKWIKIKGDNELTHCIENKTQEKPNFRDTTQMAPIVFGNVIDLKHTWKCKTHNKKECKTYNKRM